MSRRLLWAACVVILAGAASAASAQDVAPSHASYFEHYEGTATCLTCHEAEAKSFFASQHYQWRGNAPSIVNARGRQLGKINTFNDFCTSPTGNWIGIVRNSRGETLTRGCSACHAGLGKLPTAEMTADQLENIDCLICHAAGYRRELYEETGGAFAWKPILWKNREGLDSVSKRISKPTRAMCLRCHSASGGGANYKRGDIEYVLAETTRDYDVHMGTDGAGMQCITCHAGADHRVRGRGTDLAATDMPERPLTCDTTGCHGASPHRQSLLNTHVNRVNCTVCHIRDFARTDATDMRRDWSKPVYHEDTDRYTADITLEKNVTPVYAWYNGTTRAQLLGEPARTLADGSVGIMVPVGSRTDPRSRIFAFKLHRARLPKLVGRNWMVPITVEHFFANGQIDAAVRSAAHEIYGIGDARTTWVDTKRYMGLFHGVQPASRALGCLECHGESGRMNWRALGYAGDPLMRGRGAGRGRSR